MSFDFAPKPETFSHDCLLLDVLLMLGASFVSILGFECLVSWMSGLFTWLF